jgi:hypothetical protein
MTLAVSWCLIGSLLFLGSPAGQSPNYERREVAEPGPVTLTNDHPSGSFSIDPKALAKSPAVLALRVTKVVNPERTGVGFSVYLSLAPAAGSGPEEQREKILIGSFSLYPPDRPAGFVFRASEAFRQLQATKIPSKSSEVQLLIEMRRLHDRNPWTPVEIVIASPQWRQTVGTDLIPCC